MKNVIVFGATGSLGSYIISALEALEDVSLTLFVRNKSKLNPETIQKHTVVEGDVMDYNKVAEAMKGQDIVYFGLSGELDALAANVIRAMHETGMKRIIAISSMGIYGASWRATIKGGPNAPGFYNSIMLTLMKPLFPQYRILAERVEQSGLDYTILRPGKFTFDDEINYKLTYKGQPESGRDISRKSIATFVARVVSEPDTFINQNVGLSKDVTK